MILLIDNFDSFSYNLQDYLKRSGNDVHTVRYDHFAVNEKDLEKYTGFVISPGPGKPSDYPKHFELYDLVKYKKPILGVCLGHQSLGVYFGANLIKASKPMHGKISMINHNSTGLFEKIPSPTTVTRYHSLILENVPKNFQIQAKTDIGEIMAFSSNDNMISAVQFHPEAHLTEFGNDMIKNWLRIVNHLSHSKTILEPKSL